jgi:bifunctional ADP-heptose synthase (sugar kinase/adenylyltransferase)
VRTDFTQFIRSKIESNDVLMTQQVARWRHREWPIVFTYGNFEDIDSRHLDYLAEAASLGGRLIVGVRTDDLITQSSHYKPRKNQQERALFLASMVFVSMVVFLDEKCPSRLIEQICPDILVDYKEDVKKSPGYQFLMQKGSIAKFFEFNGIL